MHVTMSISTGLYPKLDLWTANKLHYITLVLRNLFKDTKLMITCLDRAHNCLLTFYRSFIGHVWLNVRYSAFMSGRSQVWILAHVGYPENFRGSLSPSQQSDHSHFLSHPFQNIIRHYIAWNADSIFKYTINKYSLQSCRMWYVLRQKKIILGEPAV
jgi:hypothetical protein